MSLQVKDKPLRSWLAFLSFLILRLLKMLRNVCNSIPNYFISSFFFPTFFPLLFLSFVDLQTITAISCSLFNESFILSGAMQEYWSALHWSQMGQSCPASIYLSVRPSIHPSVCPRRVQHWRDTSMGEGEEAQVKACRGQMENLAMNKQQIASF